MTNKKASAESNPRFFPQEYTPVCILKAKNGHFHFLTEMPSVTRSYLWYMTQPQLVHMQQLELEMQKPNRRWYATDRQSYELQCKVHASTTTGEPFVCLRDIRPAYKEMYWFGPRHAEPAAEPMALIVTVADIYLKSELHQRQLMRVLVEHVRRVLQTHKVFRHGRTMIEVRGKSPTSEQLQLLALLPGIAKIYAPSTSVTTTSENFDNNKSNSGISKNNEINIQVEEDNARAKRKSGDPRGRVLSYGAGGIPTLADQKVLALISGGIDSPVAAYRMMTRGCHVNGIHFLNSTNSTASVIAKNRRICEQLSRIQGKLEMFYVDISSLQAQIVAEVANHNRTLLYKWFMLSLSASFDDSKLLVTGDSLGQVASQTIHNISTLYMSVAKAVVAPLIGMHKTYIVEEARRIGTYDFSIQQGDDCCQYMMCKTGANLWIGKRTLEANVKRITLSALPVTKEVYVDGILDSTQSYTYTPHSSQRTQLRPLTNTSHSVNKTKIKTKSKMLSTSASINGMSYSISGKHSAATSSHLNGDVSHEVNGISSTTTPNGDKSTMELLHDQMNRCNEFLCKCDDEDTNAATHTHTNKEEAQLANSNEKENETTKYEEHIHNIQCEELEYESEEEEIEEEHTTIYFDAAAGTKMPMEVREAMFAATEANPNSLYTSGRKARMAMEQVRSELALAMRVPVSDIIFTSGGTESNNIALHGYRVEREAWSHASTNGTPASSDNTNEKTLVHVVDLVNHETGSVNTNLQRPANGRLHVDACQALTKIEFRKLDLSQVDSMSVSAHKINGPIGVGALYLRDLRCHKMYNGGSQEHGIRPGTENVPAIVGFGAALRLDRSSSVHREIEELIMWTLHDLGCEINRRGETSGFIVHATLPIGVNNTEFVSLLSTRYDVEIGTGSACKSHEVNSTVYETLNKTPAPDRAIRISWDCFATLQQAETVAQALKDAMGDLRHKREEANYEQSNVFLKK